MPLQLKYVAQQAMDKYYQEFKSDIEFFDLNDFVLYCGNAVSEVFLQWFKEQYQMLRQEKKDEVVTFEPSWCIEQELEVKEKYGKPFAAYITPIMFFPYENQSSGLQSVFHVEQGSCEMERTSMTGEWALKYLPRTNKIFYYSGTDGIFFVNKGVHNLKKVRVLFVPQVGEKMLVPDGVVDAVITKTVGTVKELEKGNIIKMALDQNMNKIPQTEINKLALP